ncbi:uncharacterized protein TNCV_4877501 [Trichonephila clavipes]|nr:uncharacterized protein TNCV_4877501 [Trichonephila clavipes]
MKISVVQKALIGIGGEAKSIKKLRSGDLLIETTSTLQSKSFLLAKTFLDSLLTLNPHRSLNSCRGVISEPYLLLPLRQKLQKDFLNRMLPCSEELQ